MSGSRVDLRAAVPGDLDWIVGLEHSPANARLIGAWSRDRHFRAIAEPDKSYFLFATEPGAPCGFAILAGLCSRLRAIELVRLAVDPPGQGLGKAALQRLIAHVFGPLGAARLFLDVFDDNARARRAYLASGFREERALPDAARRQDGTRGTLVVMALDQGSSDLRRQTTPHPRPKACPPGHSAARSP